MSDQPPDAINRRTNDDLVQRRIAAQAIDVAAIAAASALFVVFMPTLCPLMLVAFLIKDAIPNASVGKLCLGLEVIEAGTKARCSLTASIMRNLLLLPPFCAVEALILAFSTQKTRLGDRLAGTYISLAGRNDAVSSLDVPTETVTQSQTASPEAVARQLLCVDADADEEAIEDAFWDFAEYYSDDATRGLDDDELTERCRQVYQKSSTASAASFKLPDLPDETATRGDKLAYLHAHVLAVNKARDILLS